MVLRKVVSADSGIGIDVGAGIGTGADIGVDIDFYFIYFFGVVSTFVPLLFIILI